MAFISYPRKENIQRVENSGSEQELETYFGLPRHIQYCSRCTYSNQKPNSEREIAHNILSQKPTLKLDEEGVCSACIVADKKRRLIGFQENENLEIYVTNIEKRMEAMTA